MSADGPAVIIDQHKIDTSAWPVRPGATRAVYPRPLAFWREFIPDWITVAERPGGIIVLAAARPGVCAHRAMVAWLAGVRPLAGSWAER